MNTKEVIKKAIEELALGKEFTVEHPADEKMGDYASNVALVLAKEIGRNPRELALDLVNKLRDNQELMRIVEKIEPAGPGFINFYLNRSYLLGNLREVFAEGDKYGSNNDFGGEKVIIEYTDPNPFKQFHIGHLMSNAIGESLSRVMEFSGASVVRANYQGDVGLHVAKCIYGIRELLAEKKMDVEDLKNWDLEERVAFMGEAYARGARSYEEVEKVKAEIEELNKAIYKKSDLGVNEIYDLGREWSLTYFEKIYAKLGTKFDQYFFESQVGDRGLQLVKKYMKTGVFEESQGAVIFPGEKYGLHTRVFINKMGLPTYEAKDLALIQLKSERVPYEKSVIVTANEVNDYFDVILKAASLVEPELAAKTVHIGHGMLRLKNGKMSSRTGQVITGESLIADVGAEIKKKMEETEKTKEINQIDKVVTKVAIGAIKYSMLKQSPGKDIAFDFESALSFEGDSGPYLQYAYARAKNVLKKGNVKEVGFVETESLQNAEEHLIRWIARFPEIVEAAKNNLAPNLLCSYLIELSSRFNLFYGQCKIVGTPEEKFRLSLTKAMVTVLGSGLWLLGIETVETM